MKLLNKYNRINIAATIGIMLVTGIIYYYAISHILTKRIDKDLVLEENEVFNYVSLNHKLPDVYESNHQQITFLPLGKHVIKRRFLDTVYKEVDEDDMEAGRALISSVKVGGQSYRILVAQSKVETEYLIKIIFQITICVIFVLLVLLTVLNRVILKSIWQPFYKVLAQLKDFSLADKAIVNSTPSGIDEFKELDQAVITMAGRVKTDYQNLKAFTENASHELLTPISVINSKLDTLLQTDEFTDRQSKLLNDIYGTVARLTRLNKSMLLLAKIENGLIGGDEQVDVKAILEECLYQQEEIIHSKNITLETTLGEMQVSASRLLMEVLLNNLISNAIRHNYSGGEITITLQPRQLTISNTGKNTFDIEQVLKRFHKSNESEGTGLGLTICKKICDNYGFALQYNFANEKHLFSISF
ncbi:sensor histidine kinase [Mucilaginibacter gilvus]|uniref:histidine kinase n=1 Tax=Mucilaginibacter gilvus TaxID=2305909 RepID=A0A3S4Y5S4_9SPHI|nr:HAMP domain-containing sensor histidine kinase [Mucilaginibacter gilvus]RWY48061.1 HAMP domain-containing histidine kinase [Mucilaginibacter gilvus]